MIYKRESTAKQLLQAFEGLSKIVFHYTQFNKLWTILTSNQFAMVNAVQPGNSAERMLEPGAVHRFQTPTTKAGRIKTDLNNDPKRIETTAPTGPVGRAVKKRYYFCVARSPLNDYQSIHQGAVEIVLDGAKLAHTYQAAPVNYWGDGFEKNDEMEDRIYSTTPTIPNAISYIKEIHLLWSLRKDEDYPWPRFSKEITNSGVGADADKLRQCWLIAKKAGIGFYVYKDERAFKVLDKRKALPPKAFELRPTNPEYVNQKKVPDYPVAGYKDQEAGSARREYGDNAKFDYWMELYYKKSKDELSKGARDLLYNSHYKDWGSSLENSLHKSNRPENAKIIQILQKNKWHDVSQFKDFLRDKWEKIRKIDGREEGKESYRKMRKDVAAEIAKGTSLASIMKTVNGRYGETRIRSRYDDGEFYSEDPTHYLVVSPHPQEGQQMAPAEFKLPPSYNEQVEQYKAATKADQYGSSYEFTKDGDYFYAHPDYAKDPKWGDEKKPTGDKMSRRKVR